MTTTKLREVKHDDIPDTNNAKIIYNTDEGDKEIYEVDNGGYIVQPIPPPNSIIKEQINKIYDNINTNTEKLLILGYTTSGDP